MKKKIVLVVVVIIILVIVIGLFGPGVVRKIGKDDIITTAELEQAIDISELSTAEFVYNGVAEKHNEEDPEKIDCYISYNANVKVGIQMDDVTFDVDEENKTITPSLPKIAVNIATLDEEAIGYIPKNPDISLKEIITLCKEDAKNEANNSDKLYKTAEENLRTVIEALLSPIIEKTGYSIVWE